MHTIRIRLVLIEFATRSSQNTLHKENAIGEVVTEEERWKDKEKEIIEYEKFEDKKNFKRFIKYLGKLML